MSDICYCGSESGYPHDLNCPFPYYGEDSEMVLRWQRDRNAKITASLPNAADTAALRDENQRLRGIIADMLAYAQGKDECELRDSSGRIVIRMSPETYHEARAALA